MTDGLRVGRTMRLELGPFADRELPYGPGHAVPEGDSPVAVCGVVVDHFTGTWPPHGLASPPARPACERALA